MIVRIVKLTIQTEKVEQFKIFFHQSHFKIFKSIWNQTKLFFSEKPQAWSLKSIGNE